MSPLVGHFPIRLPRRNAPLNFEGLFTKRRKQLEPPNSHAALRSAFETHVGLGAGLTQLVDNETG
ncbi:hypothetical protein Poly59_38420 [Rubripirellula reticaptiva]|uniref:Uncharacterized protein n=1 Tax=Rubripirellula reticaptiva TaxID=2528013 RepID=A0A5C6EK90_9BACT|nr:hypothetical protein Poly59_38420 [Rubripirellula reticaptiva]